MVWASVGSLAAGEGGDCWSNRGGSFVSGSFSVPEGDKAAVRVFGEVPEKYFLSIGGGVGARGASGSNEAVDMILSFGLSFGLGIALDNTLGAALVYTLGCSRSLGLEVKLILSVLSEQQLRVLGALKNLFVTLSCLDLLRL